MKILKIATALGLAIVLALSLVAVSGEGDHNQMTPAQMKDMFSKCYMCRNLVPYMEKTWFNTWSMEVVNLKDGMAMVERLGDKSGMADYKTLFTAFEKSGKECEKMSNADAKKQLCSHCQSMHALMKAGAKHDWALTKDGSVGFILSDKPATVKQIHAFADQCRQMFASQE